MRIEIHKRQFRRLRRMCHLLAGQAWLDVEHTALVEVTSEEDGYPIEPALLGVEGAGVRRAISVARNPDFPICNPTTADLARKAFCRMSD